MEDIKLSKKKSSFIVNDDDNVSENNSLDIKKESKSGYPIKNWQNNSSADVQNDSDDDMLRDRLYGSDDADSLSIGGESSRTELSYIDENSDESRKQKSFFLYKLKNLEKKGYPAMRMFTMDDKLSRIKGEVERINKEIEMSRGVEFSRQGLLFFTNGLEMMNDKFDPLDLQLNGWSESIASNIENYDDVFEELYEKYHSKIAVAPEVKLVMMVLGSAFMFHFSKAFTKNSENITNVMNNPDVMSAMGKAMADEAKKEAVKKPQATHIKPQRKMKEPDTDIDDLLAHLEAESENGDGDSVKNIPLSAPKKRGRPKKTKEDEDDGKKMIFDI